MPNAFQFSGGFGAFIFVEFQPFLFDRKNPFGNYVRPLESGYLIMNLLSLMLQNERDKNEPAP